MRTVKSNCIACVGSMTRKPRRRRGPEGSDEAALPSTSRHKDAPKVPFKVPEEAVVATQGLDEWEEVLTASPSVSSSNIDSLMGPGMGLLHGVAGRSQWMEWLRQCEMNRRVSNNMTPSPGSIGSSCLPGGSQVPSAFHAEGPAYVPLPGSSPMSQVDETTSHDGLSPFVRDLGLGTGAGTFPAYNPYWNLSKESLLIDQQDIWPDIAVASIDAPRHRPIRAVRTSESTLCTLSDERQ